MFVSTRIMNAALTVVTLFVGGLLLRDGKAPMAAVVITAAIAILFAADLLFRKENSRSNSFWAMIWAVICILPFAPGFLPKHPGIEYMSLLVVCFGLPFAFNAVYYLRIGIWPKA